MVSLCWALSLALAALCLPAVAAGAEACPNEAARDGLSASLPDCRAYELVTPPETNGRLLSPLNTFAFPPNEQQFPTELASPVRNSFVYATYNSPLLGVGEPIGEIDIYEAERTGAGWATTGRYGPPGSQAVQITPGGVAADHVYGFVTVQGSLSAALQEGPTDYLVSSGQAFELTGTGSSADEPIVQGRWISEGGEHVIFTTGHSLDQSVWCFVAGVNCKVRQLEPDAPPTGTGAVYDRSADGPTHVVSLLPGDSTPIAGEQAFYKGASKDGTAVAFAIKGTLYVRVDNEETLEAAAGEATYAGLSDDGRYLFYVTGGNLHRFDTEEAEDDQVNSTGDAEIVNVSADGSHAYFISKSQIGGEGTAGQPNMYVWSGGSVKFIVTVLPGDLEGAPALANWTSWVTNHPNVSALPGPGAEASRLTPSGDVLVFESMAQLTAYDNDGHTEIYRYDDGDGSLVCVSCNPTTEPAVGDAQLQNLDITDNPNVIHNVTDDGSRVFFETTEALVAGDSNGSVNDIYEWQAEGEGGVDLISSGQSVEYPLPLGISDAPGLPTPNVLFSITPDGKDVTFLAQDILVPGAGEGGTSAIYDARVNGGFPQPVPPSICLEEGCKLPPGTPPSLFGQQSETLQGAGNFKPRKPKPPCRHAKHKKRQHCKKKKAGQGRAGASSSTSLILPTVAPESSSTEKKPVNAGGDAGTASGPVAAAGPFSEFGIESISAELSTPAAGMHPDFITTINLNHFIDEKTGKSRANARTEEVAVSLPPGLLANINAIPRCKTGEFVSWGNCPVDSQVGITRVLTELIGNNVTEPIYNLEPPHPDEELARFGISVTGLPIFIDVKVDTAGDYGATATVHSSPSVTALLAAKTTLWGNPADPSHDKQRLTPKEAAVCPGTACEAPEGKRASGLPPTAFLANPSACQSMEIGVAVKSYQLPGQIFSASAPIEPGGETTDCTGLPFDPVFESSATNPTAGQPTGLKTTLVIPQQSTEAVNSPATATMKEARVTFPQGVTINAAAADGIAACDEAQIGYHQEVDENCPDASKVGVATITSPFLPKPIGAEIFLRNQRPGHLFGLWLASDELGLHVKIPGELEPDKATGQLTAIFTDLPQAPISQVDLNVWGGARAPLAAPEACGTYTTTWSFTPHSSDPPVTGQSPMTVDQGCGARGFSPKLHAGTTNPVAGAYSPFVFDLQMDDGEQNLAALDVSLPDGLLAKPKGVGLCPEGVIASGNCPADSRIGSVTSAAGSGPYPIWIPQPGKAQPAVYLAGPYKGGPYSIAAVVPAQAGPFDLGNVVVRSALRVDPETATATVASDPLPQFVEGVAAVYRRIHVVVDRPEFMINPTDCSELAIGSHLTSVKGATAEPSARFQVDGCKALKYGPKLKLEFKGGTKRSDHPAAKAVLTQPPGQANTAKATVLLPASEFIDQDHINNPCTRVQFKEDACPKLSILGKVTATTPLLDQPLVGNVYFRSNGGERELPDIVADLRGQIHATIVGFVDSVPVKGTELSRLRVRFATVPDAPVGKFQVSFFGGNKKGLLENSRNLCRTNRRAKVSFTAQNGRQSNRNLLIKTSCGKR